MRSKERNGEKGKRKRRKACPGLDPGAKEREKYTG